jgi:methyl-accepting chemotaxis protein
MGMASTAGGAAHRIRVGVERHGRNPVANVVAMAVVLAAAAVTAVLLIMTAVAANGIARSARVIAARGGGINESTDAIIQLQRTNQEATDILHKVQPLSGKLTSVVGLAHDIDGRAGSIDGTAGTIGSTAGTVNGTASRIDATAKSISGTAGVIDDRAGTIAATAKRIDGLSGTIDASAGGINTEVAAILDTAHRIGDDVKQINLNLDATIGLAQAIKGDTGNILAEALQAQHDAGCIDQKLLGSAGQGVSCGQPVRRGAARQEPAR